MSQINNYLNKLSHIGLMSSLIKMASFFMLNPGRCSIGIVIGITIGIVIGIGHKQEMSEETRKKLSAALKGRKAPNKIEFTQEQIDLIMSYTMSGVALAQKLNVSRNVIKRVRREKKTY